MNPNVKVPTININGTSELSLRTAIRDAVDKLDAASDALNECCPHDRDYHMQGAGVGSAARDDHRERMERLYQTKEELVAIYLGIQEQGR